MKYSVFTKSVVGYKNFIKNQYSQDYIKYQVLEDGVLCAVADGHSGKYYTFADRGAKIACDTFISVFSEYIDEDKKFIAPSVINKEPADLIRNKYMSDEQFDNGLKELHEFWNNLLSGFEVNTEEKNIKRLTPFFSIACNVFLIPSTFKSSITTRSGYKDIK